MGQGCPKNETGRGCLKNKIGWGSLMLYELTQQECWEGIMCETGMVDTSSCKPKSSKAKKGIRYHSRNNAVA